jgi:hypothetical protein
MLEAAAVTDMDASVGAGAEPESPPPPQAAMIPVSPSSKAARRFTGIEIDRRERLAVRVKIIGHIPISVVDSRF